MDVVEEIVPRVPQVRSQAPVLPPCGMCGVRVESIAEDPQSGLVKRFPCGCVE